MTGSTGHARRRFVLAYNTNGFAHHRLEDALRILARLGYRGVALTLDVNHLDPGHTNRRQIAQLRTELERLRLKVAVETGARFILDPWRKHHPTLLSRRGWRIRHDFVVQCLEVARGLGAGAVSIWSGAADAAGDDRAAMIRLAGRCRRLADEAARRDVRLGFEPEPGMFIDSLSGFQELRDRVDHESFGLTLDLGHVHCQGEGPLADALEGFASDLVHVHAEDMVRGMHDHLPFGRGEMDYRPIMAALDRIAFPGLVAVELPRESHRAVDAAREAIAFLRALLRAR